MGVVKNLLVRIGADARGLVKGMNTAGNTTSRTAGKIKSSTGSMKKSVVSCFAETRRSVREYSSYVAKTKQDHKVAIQSVERLKDKIGQMEEIYGTIKNATDGLDLSKSLQEQISGAEAQLEKINVKIQKTREALGKVSAGRSSNKEARMASLEAELNSLIADSDTAAEHLRALDEAADRVGTENIGSASAAGLKNLQSEITSAKNELKTMDAVAVETGQRLKSMGVHPTLKLILKSIGTEAAQAAGGGVKKLASGLKSLAGGAVKGIASLPGKLLGIGKSASESCSGLGKMVKSIRNIGIVSLGMKVASGLFGQLRSIISSYLSQNEALNNSVTALKNQMGQALAPAINVVISAMQQLMPVVTAVANAINSVFSALFGNVAATTAGIQASASAAGGAAESLETYGFDQITKVSDNSGGGGSSSAGQDQQAQEQSALVQKLTGWVQQLKDAFKAGDWAGVGKIVGDGINSVFDSVNAIDIGAKVGTFANNVVTTLDSLLDTVNFTGIGQKAGQMLTAAMEKVDWYKTGEVIGKALTALPSVIVGFVLDTDWSVVGQSVSECIKGALDSVTEWMAGIDWLHFGESVADMVANGFYIDWEGVAKSLFTFLGTALAANVNALNGFLGQVTSSIQSYFSKKIEEAGGNVAAGLLQGILDGLASIGTWIKENIFDPFIDGFKSIFEIHSPSAVLQALGELLIDGLLKGLEKWQDILDTLSEWLTSMKDKITSAWEDCKEKTSQKWAEISSVVSNKAEEIRSAASEKFNAAKDAIASAWESAKEKTSSKLSDVKAKASEIWNDIKSDAETAAANIGSAVGEGFDSMKEGVVETFSDLWSGVKEWINKLIGGVESMANNIISGINAMIGGFNKIASVGKAIGLDLEISKISTVTLPRLAKGGIVDGATAVIAGEQGKEAIVPLENNTGWIDRLATLITSKTGGGNSGPLIFQIFVGKRKLTEYVIEDINQITRTSGVCPIHV